MCVLSRLCVCYEKDVMLLDNDNEVFSVLC